VPTVQVQQPSYSVTTGNSVTLICTVSSSLPITYLLPVTPSVVVVLCPVTPSVVVVLCQLCKLSGFKYIKQIKNRKLYKTHLLPVSLSVVVVLKENFTKNNYTNEYVIVVFNSSSCDPVHTNSHLYMQTVDIGWLLWNHQHFSAIVH
jgi:hypothetical protein